METRKDVVGYLERQKCGRVTRGVKRIWNRGLRLDGTYAGRKDVPEGFPDEEQVGEESRGGKSRSSVTASAPQVDDEGFAGGEDDQGEFLASVCCFEMY